MPFFYIYKIMKYLHKKNAYLLLEDGTLFYGKSIGENPGKSSGEICFNTGMTGYQEIITDPSYYGQIMVMTNAHIGNYGIADYESESDSPKISGLVCKNFSYNPSRMASSESLKNYLDNSNVFGISDIDTRALVTYIRENGAMNAIIASTDYPIEQSKKELTEKPSMAGLALAADVSTKKYYKFNSNPTGKTIAVLDLGIKSNILNKLDELNVELHVFPHDTSYDELLQVNPDALFLSNGPGDPEPLVEAIQLTKKAIDDNLPTFGICLGHQIIALANNIPTFKMHHGHRGINHPILNQETGKGEITSQNHGFAVELESAKANENIQITHIHLNDNSLAGLKIKDKKCFSVQYHPEASPGPHDAYYLFQEFADSI